MIKLEKDIINQLHSDRQVSFRYDLLNYNETKIGELTSLGGSLGLNSLAQIKRKGKFSFKEDELKDIDWLNDKVQPVFILKNKDYGKKKMTYFHTPIPIRYIRSSLKRGWYQNQADRYWYYVKAMSGEQDIAINKDVTSSTPPSSGSLENIVSDAPGTFAVITNQDLTTWEWVKVDLGSVRNDIDTIIHHSGYSTSFQFTTELKLEVSEDNVNWVTVYDSDLHGAFLNELGGKRFPSPKSTIAIEEEDKKEQFEFPLGVFMISSPTRTIKGRQIYREVECFDTSLVLLEDKFDTRYRILKDTNYITAITQIISSAGIWKINIPFIDAKIKTDREFEIGTSKLEAVNYLLQEINYTSIWVDELGNFTANPYILPNDRIVEYTYKNDDMSIIIPDSSIEEIDLFSVPNKWVIVATNPETPPLVGRYTNDNGGSPTSTVSRRRTIVDFREVDDIASQSILDEYVRRIAYEASNVYGKFVFDTAIMPHHSYMDSLYCEHTDLGIKNKYIETSWEMDLKANGRMKHNARRVIQI